MRAHILRKDVCKIPPRIYFPFKKMSTVKKIKVKNTPCFLIHFRIFLAGRDTESVNKPLSCSPHSRGGPELQLQVWVETQREWRSLCVLRAEVGGREALLGGCDVML